jgi:iron-sulfur cluster assembly accessory protein
MTKQLIHITSIAIKQLKKIQVNSNSKGILFSVKSGGCNGFGYKFEPINSFEHMENMIEKDGVKIEVCNKSLLYILGTKIDWKEDIMGKGFEFDNPIAQASCGCGISFSPKIE